MCAVKTTPESRATRAEVLGVLLIALAVLVALLARWGGYLPWGAR